MIFFVPALVETLPCFPSHIPGIVLVSGITSVCIVHDGGLFGAAAKVERMKQAKTEAAAVVDK